MSDSIMTILLIVKRRGITLAAIGAGTPVFDLRRRSSMDRSKVALRFAPVGLSTLTQFGSG